MNIVIKILKENVKLLYELDHDTLIQEIEQLDGVEIEEQIVFSDTLLINLSISCSRVNWFQVGKKFIQFFTKRWMLKRGDIKTYYNNKKDLLDLV